MQGPYATVDARIPAKAFPELTVAEIQDLKGAHAVINIGHMMARHWADRGDWACPSMVFDDGGYRFVKTQ
jgi:hypothetical protein